MTNMRKCSTIFKKIVNIRNDKNCNRNQKLKQEHKLYRLQFAEKRLYIVYVNKKWQRVALSMKRLRQT